MHNIAIRNSHIYLRAMLFLQFTPLKSTNMSKFHPYCLPSLNLLTIHKGL